MRGRTTGKGKTNGVKTIMLIPLDKTFLCISLMLNIKGLLLKR